MYFGLFLKIQRVYTFLQETQTVTFEEMDGITRTTIIVMLVALLLQLAQAQWPWDVVDNVVNRDGDGGGDGNTDGGVEGSGGV